MWFIRGSHKDREELRAHRPVSEGHHVLMTEDVHLGSGTACPLKAGSCTVHTGRTLHYTGPNNTEKHRRAYIINCRPGDMVAYERENAYDHGRKGVEDILPKD